MYIIASKAELGIHSRLLLCLFWSIAFLLSGFGTRIIYYNRSPKRLPWQAVDLSSLASESDAIALAIPLSAQTKGMLNKSFFSQLKQGCILASISADEIIDKAAFEQALIARNIAAAGLDLHAPWPELQTHRQVVMTPVKGWYTKECMQRRMQSWVDTVNGYLAGDNQNAIV